MSRDYGDLERDFIDGLAADTGRDLAQWMALIDSETFAHRNDMIDWLRQRGLTFAKASRLERIHNNGGRPLYGEKPPAPLPSAEPVVALPSPAPITSAPQPAPPPPPTASVTAPTDRAPAASADPTALPAFLARAKGYRPLAELLIRVIRAAVPETEITVHAGHADLATSGVYGALAVTAKDVRLVLDLGDMPFSDQIKRLRVPGTLPNLTHCLVLDDARKIDANVADLIRTAASRVAG